MKKTLLMAMLLGLSPGLGSAQTMDELLNDGKNTDNVLTLSMGLARQNYSPLNQINKGNVKRLVPVWSTSLMNEAGELAAPVVHNGVIYAINGKWTFAIDVETGQPIWRTPVQVEPGNPPVKTPIKRGAPTIYNRKSFPITLGNYPVSYSIN